MTVEEKAEEILQTKGSMTFCAKGCGYTEKVKELIAIGLAERSAELEIKEKFIKYWQREYKAKSNDVIELQKEILELEKENARLSNSVTELANSKTELENKVTELEKQIKKMKSENNSCPDVMCEDCNKECELKKIMGGTK